MFDAKRLLEQFIGGSHHGRRPGGYSGGSYGGAPFGGSPGGLGGAGLASGLAGLLLRSKKGRKYGGSGLKMGGMAMVASLAYQAYQDWQQSQARGTHGGVGAADPRWHSAPQAGPDHSEERDAGWLAGAAPLPPAGSRFLPEDEAGQQSISQGLLRAMIAAAKADGHVDAKEQAAIFAEMDKLDLDPHDKAFVVDELRAPLDVDAVARAARNPEEAAQIYAASLLAIDVDNAAERAYLALLAARLGLEDALVDHLHRTVEGAGREG
jgi:uncharacterized membrane protein YebE (DUF533 family)